MTEVKCPEEVPLTLECGLEQEGLSCGYDCVCCDGTTERNEVGAMHVVTAVSLVTEVAPVTREVILKLRLLEKRHPVAVCCCHIAFICRCLGDAYTKSFQLL